MAFRFAGNMLFYLKMTYSQVTTQKTIYCNKP